jgi:hypothetical protein
LLRKASHPAFSADTLSMLVMLKVETGEEPLPLEKISLSACAMSWSCVVTPSWTKTARFTVSRGRIRMAATALPTAEVRVMLKGTLLQSSTTRSDISCGR